MKDPLQTTVEDFDHKALEQIKRHAALILTMDRDTSGEYSFARDALQMLHTSLNMIETVHQQNITLARLAAKA